MLDTSLIHVNRGLVSAVTAGRRSDAIAAIWGVILCLICPLHIQWILESDACCICACSSPLFDIEFWLFESESNGPQSRFTEERIPRSNQQESDLWMPSSWFNHFFDGLSHLPFKYEQHQKCCITLMHRLALLFYPPFFYLSFLYVFIYKLKCTTHPSSRVLFLSDILNIKEFSVIGCMAYTLSNRSNVLFSAQYGDCVTGIV